MDARGAVVQDNPFTPEYPAGPFFAGRDRQLRQLGELLGALTRGNSSNLCVVGRGGEGKTSYLEKIVDEAKCGGLVAAKCTLDLAKPAETDIDTIFQGLLREIEIVTGQQQLESDWKSGERSIFRSPHYKEVRGDQLQMDFQRVLALLPNEIKGCVVCIDEGQRINPIALSALKNALQPVKRGFMIVLSLLNETTRENKEKGEEILDDLAAKAGDPGASRFFKYNFASLGPFDSQFEAEDCVRMRLRNNVVTFSGEVVSHIPKIVGRHPAGIIALARAVYQRTTEGGSAEADMKALRQAFVGEHQGEVTEAIRFCQQLSNTDRTIYRAALSFENRFSCMQVARHLLAESNEFPSDHLVDSIRLAMGRLLANGRCTKDGEVEYWFTESTQAYALRLALEQ